MIAFAYALNHTIEGKYIHVYNNIWMQKGTHHADLRDNSTLNMEAARLSDLPEGQNFTMADFTYANSAVVSRMFTHLQNTSFPGFSVSTNTQVPKSISPPLQENDIEFNDQGVREINSVKIRQYQLSGNW